MRRTVRASLCSQVTIPKGSKVEGTVRNLNRTEPDTFADGFLKWIASSFGLALLPLIAKMIVSPSGTREAEFCLFVLVLGTCGSLDAAFTHGSWAMRTFLIFGGVFSVLYGAIGYAEFSSSKVFPADGLLPWVAGVLSVLYFLYKVPVLINECN